MSCLGNPVGLGSPPSGKGGLPSFQVTRTLQVAPAHPEEAWTPVQAQWGPACCRGIQGNGGRKGSLTPFPPTHLPPASIRATLLLSIFCGEFPCKILFEQSFPPLQTFCKPLIQPCPPCLAASRGSQPGGLEPNPIYNTY